MSDRLVICPYCKVPLVEHDTSLILGIEWAKCPRAPEGTFTEASEDGPERVYVWPRQRGRA